MSETQDTGCPPFACRNGNGIFYYATHASSSSSSSNYRSPLTIFFCSFFFLLRRLLTQVVDEDVYQRQGENIITWCEAPPLIGAANGAGAGAGGTGVDLALSFQVRFKKCRQASLTSPRMYI